MRKRTRSREFALQILYQADLSSADLDEVLEDFWREKIDAMLSGDEKEFVEEGKEDPEIRTYAEKLARGVVGSIKKVDGIIEKSATNWNLERMAYIDRNILRLAVYELIFSEDIPVKVAINEAVELAKKYGDSDSSKFVNGVLDKIAKTENKQ